MKRLSLFIALSIVCLLFPQMSGAMVYVPESPSSQDAVFNPADKTVTVSAIAPTKTEYDWDTYLQYDLPYISYVLIERHVQGEPWPTEEYARINDPKMGEKFEFVDKNIELDCKYEYRISCYVDAQGSSTVFATVYTGATPGEITDFKLSVKDHLANAVDMTMTAPLKSDAGADLTEPMAIVIQQYEGWSFTTIQTIENVKPGQVCTWQHAGLELGHRYEYRAVAKVGKNGMGQGSPVSIYVGLDYPGTPHNFTAVSKGESVELTWEAPLAGGRNGQYNPEATTYILSREYIDGQKEVIANGLTDTKFTDSPGFEEERALTYILVAENAAGSSQKEAKSAEVVVGKPSVLPFAESFKKGLLDHMGWTRETSQNDPYFNYEAWNFVTTGTLFYFPTDEYIEITAQDADEGFASCLFYGDSKDGQTETLISPHVDVTGMEKVEVVFHYFDMVAEATKNEVLAFVSIDNGEWAPAFKSVPAAEGTQPQWKEVKIPVELKKAASNIRVKIQAIRHDGPVTNVYLDNITVREFKDSGIEMVPVVDNDENATPVYYNLNGVCFEEPETPGIYIKRCGSKAEKVIVR